MLRVLLLSVVMASVLGDLVSTPGPETPEPCNRDGETGECVKYYLCDANDTIGYQDPGLIDILPADEQCMSFMDVCCKIGSKLIQLKPDPISKERVGCGYLNPKGVGPVIETLGIDQAKFGEFPWIVAILKVVPLNESQPEGKKLNVYEGGGSLIHPSVVLTAAHNAGSPPLRIRAGEWDTQTKGELYAHQDRDVASIILHDDYNSRSLKNDIALLFLSAPVELAPHIGVACLPRPDEGARVATRCIATGWGKNSFGKESRYQVILKKVDVPMVERESCQKALRSTRLGLNFNLHSSFMCAGGEKDKDTCKGDGGSPLVCPMESQQDRYVQNGIVAWGIGCGQDSIPGVYVDVAKFRNWIDNAVNGKGFDISTYSDY